MHGLGLFQGVKAIQGLGSGCGCFGAYRVQAFYGHYGGGLFKVEGHIGFGGSKGFGRSRLEASGWSLAGLCPVFVGGTEGQVSMRCPLRSTFAVSGLKV